MYLLILVSLAAALSPWSIRHQGLLREGQLQPLFLESQKSLQLNHDLHTKGPSYCFILPQTLTFLMHQRSQIHTNTLIFLRQRRLASSHLEKFDSELPILSIAEGTTRHGGGFADHPLVGHLVSYQLRARVELSLRHIAPPWRPLACQNKCTQAVQTVDQHAVLRKIKKEFTTAKLKWFTPFKTNLEPLRLFVLQLGISYLRPVNSEGIRWWNAILRLRHRQ